MAILWLRPLGQPQENTACLLLLQLLCHPREDKLICSFYTSSSLLASPLTPCLPWIPWIVRTLRNSKTTGVAGRISKTIIILGTGLPRWLSGKESTCRAGNVGVIPGSGRSQGPQQPWTTQQLSSLGSFSLTSPRPVAGEARDPEMPRNTEMQPTPESVPGKSHRQRRLADYNPRGCKRITHGLVTKQQK